MADMISILPVEVIYHILSFLPTQDVIGTCLLSKRWMRLWQSVPSLYFDDQSYLINNRPYYRFQKFIYTTILARDAHQPITGFSLQCLADNFDLSESDVNIWVNAAIQRGLENLHIQLLSPLCLRNCIFTCKTLVFLQFVRLDVDVFSSVDLPSLKKILLHDVMFPEWQYLMKLLSGCPILEDMHVKHIGVKRFPGPPPSNKSFESLSKLFRADLYDMASNIPLKAICNVEFLRIDKYTGRGIPIFPNLTHLELMSVSGMTWRWVFAMLKKCPKLQHFVLNMTNKSYDDVVWTGSYLVPECISSQLRKCSITNYKGTKSELHFVKYIMQNSKVLQTMTICTRRSSSIKNKFEMLQELSLSPRGSTICELSFQ